MTTNVHAKVSFCRDFSALPQYNARMRICWLDDNVSCKLWFIEGLVIVAQEHVPAAYSILHK